VTVEQSVAAEAAGDWRPRVGSVAAPPVGAALTGCVDTSRLPSVPVDSRG
jgi:hypothetical protein